MPANFLPVVDRELRVAAHRRSTYRMRMATVVLAAGLGVLFILGWWSGAAASSGRSMFWGLAGLALFLGVLDSVRSASDALSAERREGTLGFLFLTDLRAYDIVLGKAAAGSLQRFFALLGVLPLLVLAVPAGGVMGGEIGRMALALLSALVVSTAIGLAVSAFSRDAVRSFSIAAVLTVVVAFAPFGVAKLAQVARIGVVLTGVAPASPLYAFVAAEDGVYRSGAGGYWLSLLAGQILAWGCLALACWQTPRAFQEPSAPARRFVPKPAGRSEARRLERRRWLEQDPVFWLQSRGQRGGFGLWLAAAVVLLGLGAVLASNPLMGSALVPMTMFAGFLLRWGIKVGLTIQVTQAFAALREREGSDLLLATPLTERDVVRGYGRATVHQWRGPVILALAFECTSLLQSLLGSPGAVRISGNAGPLYPLLVVASFLLDLAALYWAGAWMAVRSGRANTAALRALVLVQVLPGLVCCGLPIISDILFLLWGRSRLQAGFRSWLPRAEGREQPKRGVIGWLFGRDASG